MQGQSGLHRIRGTSYLAVLLLSLALLLGAATVAQAATVTWLYAQPASGLITTQNTQSIAVRATAPSSGAALLPTTARMWIDGIELSRPPLYTTPTRGSVYNVLIRRSPQVLLDDGAHTVRASIADTLGVVSEYSWSFTIGAPPQTSGWYPTGAVNEQLPSFGLSASDNSADGLAVTATLRQGSASGPVVDTFTGSYPQGPMSWTPSAPLEAGTYFVTVDVVDATALVATRSWSFTVEAPDAMSLAVDCTSCHPAPPEGLAHVAGTNCAPCHPGKTLDHDRPTFATTCSESYCHPGTGLNLEHPVGTVYITDLASCPVCHTSSNPAAPQHVEADVDVAHVTATTGCEDCHDTDLVAEHAKYPGDSAFKYQCDTCHTSTDPLVVAAIAAGDTSCVACHGATHGPESHTADIATLGMAGTWTYERADAAVQGRLMNVPYAYSDIACTDCHSAVISDDHAACATCHPTAREAVGTWDKSCYACHPQATVHTAAGLSTVHTLSDPNSSDEGSCGFVSPTSGRRPCHYPDIVQEHNRKISPDLFSADITLSVTCEECHTNAATLAALASGGGWDGTCDDCHDGTALVNHSLVGTARYDEVYAIHQYTGGPLYDNGSGNVGSNAMDAHGPVRVSTGGPNLITGCGAPTCHTEAFIGGGWPNGAGPACNECHGPNVAPVAPFAGAFAWHSDALTDGNALTTEMVLTLPGALPAGSTLDFKTLYDIETDWDYGYVQVSDNGGASWTSLANDLTTTTNPYGQNAGNGITGSNGGWTDASFDLSAYAGQTVQIRFLYATDFYYYGTGWRIDDVKVGPSGSPIFTEDGESVNPAVSVSSTISYMAWDDAAEADVLVEEPTTAFGWYRFP